jgi:NADH-quinone oxidoreductase subunit M
LGAAYFLWTLQRMFFGKESLKGGAVWKTALTDLNLREKLTLARIGHHRPGIGCNAIIGF